MLFRSFQGPFIEVDISISGNIRLKVSTSSLQPAFGSCFRAKSIQKSERALAKLLYSGLSFLRKGYKSNRLRKTYCVKSELEQQMLSSKSRMCEIQIKSASRRFYITDFINISLDLSQIEKVPTPKCDLKFIECKLPRRQPNSSGAS